MLYDLMKAGHIVAVVTWFGGMLSVALLLRYGGKGMYVKDMAMSLHAWDRKVTTPAMIATWALGLTMAMSTNWFASGWMIAKLFLVVALSALHGFMSGQLRRATAGQTISSGPLVQGTPAIMLLILCGIVSLVVTKAF
jgi:putative membrane protein